MKKNLLIGAVGAAFLVGALVSEAQTNVSTLVVPRINETLDGTATDGGSSGMLQVPIRSQGIYASSQFPAGRLIIRELRMRPARFGNAFTSTFPNVQLNLSTTQAQPDQLSSTFASNVGSNDTVVFQGPITLSSRFTGPATGPKDFDIIIPFSRSFVYDSSAGNLLVEFRSSSPPASSPIDAGGSATDGCSRGFATDPNATTGAARDKAAEVFQLVYTTEGSAPTIVTGPTSQTVTEGADVSFTVSASGTPPLAYQWLRNGSEVFGATAASLVLSNVQVTVAGTYSVRVSNPWGSVTSGGAVLTVNSQPSLPADYDLSRDFSLAGNPNGAWSYGREDTLGGAFTLLGTSKYNYDANGVPVEVWAINSSSQPAVLHNATTNTVITDGGQGVYPPGTIWFGPAPEGGNPGNFCVVRFTVPNGRDGTYRLDASVAPSYNLT
ncbi:MAG TPA: immunoglobulin domain-containing protein, partial [Candidatus Binatia bacterium]|nr:immunoglobulin domain-containing protein [Candidatus Binatia bacterium]